MRVTIFGTGYVGLVTGACLADVGHNVVCVDVDQTKIDALNSGVVPIYEPGLDELVKTNFESKRIRFTTDAQMAVSHGQIQFIAVGTPPDEDGSADLQYVLAVAKTIASHMDSYKVIVDKSTVPVGTADKVTAQIEATLASMNKSLSFDVASNPEFLKEGAAISDFMKPDRIVVGTDSDNVRSLMHELYAPFNRNHDRMVFMDVRSAELTKYAANAMLATKISFMNEMANLAERLGADVEEVRKGIGSDPRIGYHFIYPGCGFGGSCFPKDVQALAKTAEETGYQAELLKAVQQVNDRQKNRLYEKLEAYFEGELKGKTFALWGLSFKPNTDDMREAPSRALMEALWRAGASVKAYDPEAMDECQRIYGARSDLYLMGTKEATLKNSDALLICTEWKQFRAPDFEFIRQELNIPVIFDGRNLYDPKTVQGKEIKYFSIGRVPS
ncbi:MAG TPA: UDP-glucose 6-dehydrogenase [Gammaproteobacteria bacterium]|nr:UDP-glucose 6-dehydrogenase [Gammaproteobacteria bacterium]